MRTTCYLAVIALAGAWAVGREPVLSADSLYDLHDSADRVKWSLQLNEEEFGALEQALEVLVGEPARDLVERMDDAPLEIPPSTRRANESRVLAPLGGMSYRQLVEAAVVKVRDERTRLLGELRRERSALGASHRSLGAIEVAEGRYYSSVTSGERWVDFNVYNGTDEALTGLVLDCRFVGATGAPEEGVCRLDFGGPVSPGATALGTAALAWAPLGDPGTAVSGSPTRAFGEDGRLVWSIPSSIGVDAHDRIAEIESRLAELARELEVLQVDAVASR